MMHFSFHVSLFPLLFVCAAWHRQCFFLCHDERTHQGSVPCQGYGCLLFQAGNLWRHRLSSHSICSFILFNQLTYLVFPFTQQLVYLCLFILSYFADNLPGMYINTFCCKICFIYFIYKQLLGLAC